MDPAVVREIEDLRGLNVAGLRTRYLAVIGEESKSSRSCAQAREARSSSG
jgi:hypothetical protein